MGGPADITLNTIDELVVNRWNGTPDLRATNYATYRIPSPTGGTMQVYVRMNQRWCEVAVDRFRTTPRVRQPSESWFGVNIWPLVVAASKQSRTGGVLPIGGGSYASAYPLDRSTLPEVLTAWIDQELTWGLPPKRSRWLAGRDLPTGRSPGGPGRARPRRKTKRLRTRSCHCPPSVSG